METIHVYIKVEINKFNFCVLKATFQIRVGNTKNNDMYNGLNNLLQAKL